MYFAMLLVSSIVVLFMHKLITFYLLCTWVYILYATTESATEVMLDMGMIILDESEGIYAKS
jgi:hypothetical protein